jgi:hypothetical protein
MNKIVLTALASAALSLGAQAGQPIVDKNPKNPVEEPCFADQEFQIDTYAVYSNYKGDTGAGGGLSLNYFFHRNIGIGADVNVVDTDDTAWTYGAHLLFRYPIESGSLCWAPYAKIGGGITDNDVKAGYYGAGGGIELRFSPKWGIYGEGGYYWAAADQDFAQARLGFRWVF